MTKIFDLFEMGPGRYQPDPKFTYSDDHPGYRLDQRRLAFFVGLVALGLPIVMLIGWINGTCLYDSISHFYYAQFLGGVFIAGLVFIGTFLLAYRGESARENRLATIAGIGALFIALFPTSGRGCEKANFSGRALADFTLKKGDSFVEVIPAVEGNTFFELFNGSAILHGLGATLLFAFLAWYSFFVFTRVIDNVHGPEGSLTPQKRYRNKIYKASGILIVVSMLSILIGIALDKFFKLNLWDFYNLTFWFESLALWAFGVSWMLKGRFLDKLLLDARETQNKT
jgi:hypothetical protein